MQVLRAANISPRSADLISADLTVRNVTIPSTVRFISSNVMSIGAPLSANTTFSPVEMSVIVLDLRNEYAREKARRGGVESRHA
jgi:hypothetical protein